MSPVTNPDWWAYHKVWVGTFQWLVLPLPVFAWLCGLTASGSNLTLGALV